MTLLPENNQLIQSAVNSIRFLSADGVQKANSGHPGLPMGAAAMAYTIWMRHLNHNPQNPQWVGRDRFILSGGHGSMLLYSLLYLCGYDLSLDELKQFRQWKSRTPGHPEFGLTAGVEVTTGPLGQGFVNGVGMAIAQAHLAAEFNRPGFELLDNYIYAIVTDGDLMEGITSEAASLAGHLKLGRLIFLYDDNRISIDGSTELAFTEDRAARFLAYGWQVLHVEDGNDVEVIDLAIQEAKKDERPSIIVCRTHIGFGLPTKQDSEKAHGSPPGEEELAQAKKNFGWQVEPSFFVPENVLAHFRIAVEKGQESQKAWEMMFSNYKNNFADLAAEFERRMKTELPKGWEKALPEFSADEKGMATRSASGKVINALAKKLPELVGGSADLAPSNNTWIDGSPAFQAISPEGRNFHFGVREHAMGGIINGMAVYGGLIPYAATFLVFSDYLRGSLRVSALSHYPSVWIFTHDSIGVGEDGPTHQPIEHLASLRAIPNLVTIRPADANETVVAWKVAIERRHAPTALILTRQNLPTVDRSIYTSASELIRGAYLLGDIGDGEPDLILMASGSEVSLIIKAGMTLASSGTNVRLVSFPSWELFKQQDTQYRDYILPPKLKARIAVEAGISQGWERWVGDEGYIISIDHYGASAPAATLFKEFGITVEHIIEKARKLIKD